MADVAIGVERFSKRYRRGLPCGNDRLSEAMSNLGKLSLAFPRRLWRRVPAAPSERTAEFWALQDVSFEVKRGEVVGIIGRNGAGKTTLLKILSRITEPTGGRFGLAGRVGSLLEVGTGFHPELAGRENVYLNGSFLGMTRAEVRKKFDEIAAFAEIDDFLDTPVKRYSSGMQMRLGFAVAAHLEPEILFVDEVLAVGDASFQKKCLAKVAELARLGRTALFISHPMGAITALCRRACLLRDGQLVLSGDPKAVTEAYHREFQAIPVGDLRARQDIPADGVRFTGWCVDGPAEDNHMIASGEGCVLKFRFITRRRIREGHFGIAIYTRDGALVWAMRSLDHGAAVSIPSGCHEAEFRLGQFPVWPGEYQVLVSV